MALKDKRLIFLMVVSRSLFVSEVGDDSRCRVANRIRRYTLPSSSVLKLPLQKMPNALCCPSPTTACRGLST